MGNALGYRSFGDAGVHEFFDRPELAPAPSEVLIDVVAAGVNPLDALLRSGHVPDINGHVAFPQVLGMEAAGVVTAVGADVDELSVGDRVFGFALTGAGTYATSTLLLADATARTPPSLLDTWAATIPVAATTAIDVLDQLDLPPGGTILVNGIGGGVGSAAAQLARARGLQVVGTGSTSKWALATSIGATFVDYTRGSAVDRLRELAPAGYDGVVDLVGGGSLREVAALAARPSAVIAVGDPSVVELGGAVVERHLGRPTLERAARSMVAGDLDPHITEVFPLARADEALARVESGHALGKLVIDLST